MRFPVGNESVLERLLGPSVLCSSRFTLKEVKELVQFAENGRSYIL